MRLLTSFTTFEEFRSKAPMFRNANIEVVQGRGWGEPGHDVIEIHLEPAFLEQKGNVIQRLVCMIFAP